MQFGEPAAISRGNGHPFARTKESEQAPGLGVPQSSNLHGLWLQGVSHSGIGVMATWNGGCHASAPYIPNPRNDRSRKHIMRRPRVLLADDRQMLFFRLFHSNKNGRRLS